MCRRSRRRSTRIPWVRSCGEAFAGCAAETCLSLRLPLCCPAAELAFAGTLADSALDGACRSQSAFLRHTRPRATALVAMAGARAEGTDLAFIFHRRG